MFHQALGHPLEAPFAIGQVRQPGDGAMRSCGGHQSGSELFRKDCPDILLSRRPRQIDLRG